MNNMSPYLPLGNFNNTLSVYPKQVGNMLFWHAISQELLYVLYFVFVKFSHWMITAKKMVISSLHCTITIVVCVGTLKKMPRVTARWIVAAVQDTHAMAWPSLMEIIECQTVCSYALLVVNGIPITISKFSKWPFQAVAIWYQHSKKLFSGFWYMVRMSLEDSSRFIIYVLALFTDRSFAVFPLLVGSKTLKRKFNTTFCADLCRHATSPVDVPGEDAAAWPGTKRSGATLAATVGWHN